MCHIPNLHYTCEQWAIFPNFPKKLLFHVWKKNDFFICLKKKNSNDYKQKDASISHAQANLTHFSYEHIMRHGNDDGGGGDGGSIIWFSLQKTLGNSLTILCQVNCNKRFAFKSEGTLAKIRGNVLHPTSSCAILSCIRLTVAP